MSAHVDTKQLQRDLAYAEAQSEYWTNYCATLQEEIGRRTSPWPWPKTPSPMVKMWLAEYARMLDKPLIFVKRP